MKSRKETAMKNKEVRTFHLDGDVVEVPIVFVNRQYGTSKMNSSIFGEALFGVIRLRIDSWHKKYPQKSNK